MLIATSVTAAVAVSDADSGACLSRHEWIRRPLPADGRVWAVTADDPGLVGKGVELRADRLLEHGEGPAHEIGPADGTGEDHVTDDDEGLGGAVDHETDSARRVPRRVADLEFETTPFKFLPLIEQPIKASIAVP